MFWISFSVLPQFAWRRLQFTVLGHAPSMPSHFATTASHTLIRSTALELRGRRPKSAALLRGLPMA
eukprot:1195328-Prorocentrum_minimum.AAC.2